MSTTPYITTIMCLAFSLGTFFQLSLKNKMSKQTLLLKISAWAILTISIFICGYAIGWVRAIPLWIVLLCLVGIVSLYIGNQWQKPHKTMSLICFPIALIGIALNVTGASL